MRNSAEVPIRSAGNLGLGRLFVGTLRPSWRLWPLSSMDWKKNEWRGDERLQELHAKILSLEREIKAAVLVEAQAQVRVVGATDAVGRAETKAQEAAAAVEEFDGQKDSAVAENARMRSKVDEATAAVDAARLALERFGVVSPTGGRELASPTGDVDKASSAALRSLSDRELNEVRKLGKPPQIVRRSLELVQSMLAVADGAESLPAASSSSSEGQWAELQKMLARDDFIKRVLALTPAALAKSPKLLREIADRWPTLRHAVGTVAAPRWKAAAGLAKAGRAGLKENDKAGADQPKGAEKAGSATAGKAGGGGFNAEMLGRLAASRTGAMSAASRSTSPRGRVGRMMAVVAAAAAEADASAAASGDKTAASTGLAALTVESVEYAGSPRMPSDPLGWDPFGCLRMPSDSF